MKTEKLDTDKLVRLMDESDAKWFHNHVDYKYREHLEFTAKYIATNYAKKEK